MHICKYLNYALCWNSIYVKQTYVGIHILYAHTSKIDHIDKVFLGNGEYFPNPAFITVKKKRVLIFKPIDYKAFNTGFKVWFKRICMNGILGFPWSLNSLRITYWIIHYFFYCKHYGITYDYINSNGITLIYVI